MDCTYLVHKICGYCYLKKEFTYRQLDDIFEGGNTVPYENVYIRKTGLQKSLVITAI